MTTEQAPEISRSSTLPLHVQLQEVLRAQVLSGRWDPGHAIPSENELVAQYGVSRATVRQALAALVQDGLLYRRQGKGTFAARPKFGLPLDVLRGFAEELQLRGLAPVIQVLGILEAEAEPEAGRALRLTAPGRAVLVERVISVEGEPLLWDRTYLPKALDVPLSAEVLAHRPLFELIEASGHPIAEAEQTIEAGLAGEYAATRHLWVEAEAPVLAVRRTTYGEDGAPLEHAVAVYRADRYRYRVSLQRRPWR